MQWNAGKFHRRKRKLFITLMSQNKPNSRVNHLVSNYFIKPLLDPAMISLRWASYCISELILLLRKEFGSGSLRNCDINSDTELAIKHAVMMRKDLNHLQMFGLAFFTFLLTFFHGWIQLLVKAKIFYISTLFVSSLLFAVLHAIQQNARLKQQVSITGFFQQKGCLVLGLLQSIITIWMGSLVKNSVANANRADVYELFLVLTVPSIIICMQLFNNFNINATESIIFILSGIKLLVLCRDPVFLPHASGAVICFWISIFYGLFLALLYLNLRTTHLLSIIQLLTAWNIPVSFFLAIFHEEDFHQFWSIRVISILFVLACLSFAKMASTFILLKYSNPLHCIITTNLSWIPLMLVRAFIFKFLFFISSFKLLFLLILDLFVIMFKEKLDKFVETLKPKINEQDTSIGCK